MPIKTAILGYGRSGSSLHAGPVEKHDEFAMQAVCDIDRAALDKAGARFNCRLYEDYKEMLAKEDLDFVIIVTRSSQHAEMARDCLLAGKNVLVTKPWAVNAAEAESMIAAAKVSGKMLLPWLPARWSCDLRAIKKVIDSGAIGKIYQVQRSQSIFSRRSDWQTERKFGGGYLLNWGPHLIDQPLQLKTAPVVSVYAELKQLINPNDGEDAYYLIMKTADRVTFISEFCIAAPGIPNWIIKGDRGTIFVHANKLQIHKAVFADETDPAKYGTGAKLEIEEQTAGDMYAIYGDQFEIYKHIAEALLGKTRYEVSCESALLLSRIMDAARVSQNTGQAVFL